MPSRAASGVLPTGLSALDRALRIGGYPRGRIVEIFGEEASGKTSLALRAAAAAQRRASLAAFIDAEHSLDLDYARSLGVDTGALLLSRPACGEQALEIVEILLRSGAVEIVAVDSVAALVPRVEIDLRVGEAQAGLQALLMSQSLRRISAASARSGGVVIFINQIRQQRAPLGLHETTVGGCALKLCASVRIDVRCAGAKHRHRSRVSVVKDVLGGTLTSFDVDLAADP